MGEEDKEYLPTAQRNAIENNTFEDMIKLVASLSDIFKFNLGCKVRNRHSENGYVEMCAIDYRGAIYLVNLENGKSHWYSEFEITKQQFDPENKEMDKQAKQSIKTDIPDPKGIEVS